MSYLFIFIDGIGIGERDMTSNPFAAAKSKYFTAFLDDETVFTETHRDGVIVPTDACLGVDGLPQSGTGQTSLFTGINAQKEVGRHVNAFPTPPLRKLLHSTNILMESHSRGFKTTFANAYHKKYFERPKKMISATTWLVLSSGIKINYLEDINEGRAVFHDLTNDYLIKEGYKVNKMTPYESGSVLANVTAEHDLTLFEYVMTDSVGHKREMKLALQEVNKLDEFLDGLFDMVELDNHTALISSDHGNMEDVSVRTHTRNPVPTIIWGKDKEQFQQGIEKITDITPSLLSALSSASL